MEGPLPFPFERVGICLLLGSPSRPCFAFVSRPLSFALSPTEQGPFYTKIFHHLFTLFSSHI